MAKPGASTTPLLVGLIFSFVIAIGLIVPCYKQNEELAQAQRAVTDANSRLQRETEVARGYAREIREIRALVQGDPDRVVNREAYQEAILAPADEKLKQLLDPAWIPTETWQRIQDQQAKAVWENLSRYQGKENFSLVFLFDKKLYDMLRAAVHVLPRTRQERYAAREEYQSVRASSLRDVAARRREIEELQGEKRTLASQIQDLAARFDNERRDFHQEKDRLLKERSRLEQDFRVTEGKLQAANVELASRIGDLNRKRDKSFAENSPPDGEVVFADAGLGYAWIDLGRAHGLRRGTQFQVYRFVKGGLQKIKGLIHVQRLEEDMAQCSILPRQEVRHPVTGERVLVPDPEDPIIKGDLIRTPYFDKNEQVTFVFLGTKLTNRYYDLPEVQRKLREMGAKVDPDVSIGTDFVVLLGSTADDAELEARVKRAGQFGVIFMREEELLEYLGR